MDFVDTFPLLWQIIIFFLINGEMQSKIPTQLHASLKGNETSTANEYQHHQHYCTQHPGLQETGHCMEVSVRLPSLLCFCIIFYLGSRQEGKEKQPHGHITLLKSSMGELMGFYLFNTTRSQTTDGSEDRTWSGVPVLCWGKEKL